LVRTEVRKKCPSKAEQDEENGRADAVPAGRLLTAFALSAVLLFPVNPAYPVFRENVHDAVLLWPVNS
jgi:hypothetical protein